jgi:hypothetical protein
MAQQPPTYTIETLERWTGEGPEPIGKPFMDLTLGGVICLTCPRCLKCEVWISLRPLAAARERHRSCRVAAASQNDQLVA